MSGTCSAVDPTCVRGQLPASLLLAGQPVAQPKGVADVHHIVALLGVKLLDGESDEGLLAVDQLPCGPGVGGVAVDVLDGA